jgi:RNA polymerase sigma-70 factor, ECF subfamily
MSPLTARRVIYLSDMLRMQAASQGSATSQAQPGASDERALVRIARTDTTAFGELYLRYAPRVFSYLCTRTNSVDDAADLTQQVFANALAGIGRYRESAVPFSAWLFRIARNAATDLNRRRRPTLPLEAARGLIDPADPAHAAIVADDIRELKALVAQLPDSEREMLALRFAAGLTSREIGALVGRSESAVKKRLWRILQMLKEKHDADSR